MILWLIGTLAIAGWAGYAVGQRRAIGNYAAYEELRDTQIEGRGIVLRRIVVGR
jgi:hypothetical protein